MTLDQWKNSTLKNYQDKYNPPLNEVEHVIDYLKAHPQERLQRASYPQLLKKSKDWTTRIIERSQNVREAGEVRVIHRFDTGMKFVTLQDQMSKDWESKHMGHCVASYKDREGLYSLRDAQHIPHVTVEVAHGEVRQAVGKGNGPIPLRYLQLMSDILKRFKNHEAAFRGYLQVSLAHHNFLKKNFDGYKVVKINNKLLQIERQALELKPNHSIRDFSKLKFFINGQIECLEALRLIVAKVNNLDHHECSQISYRLPGTLKVLIESGNTKSPFWQFFQFNRVSVAQSEFLQEYFTGVEIVTCGKVIFARDYEKMIKPFPKVNYKYLGYFLTQTPKAYPSRKQSFGYRGTETIKDSPELIEIVTQFLKNGYEPKGKKTFTEMIEQDIVDDQIRLVLHKTSYGEISPYLANFITTYFTDYDLFTLNNRHYFNVSEIRIIKNASEDEWKKLNHEINYPSIDCDYGNGVSGLFCKLFMKDVEE